MKFAIYITQLFDILEHLNAILIVALKPIRSKIYTENISIRARNSLYTQILDQV